MIGTYVIHQIECGAQVVPMFDSWAGHLCPTDYKTFALPYQKMVVDKVKAKYPNTPMILYIAITDLVRYAINQNHSFSL